MINNGLFSKLFIDDVRSSVALDDQGEGRLATLAHLWKSHDAAGSDSLWSSFCKQALSGLEFVPANQSEGDGFYPLYEDWGFQNVLTVVLVLGADADIDDTRVGRFWPVKLVKKLRRRQLTWGILTNGNVWRLYSTKTAKPYEDYVELPLARALEQQDKTEYALFERFFHADSFVPDEDDGDEKPKSEGTAVRIYKCPLDRDAEESEQILEEKVKKPFLRQVDEVLQYICNGFIADTARPGEDYTEEERGEIFQSAVKLLYRCMFLFYAESRKLLPSDEGKRQEYDSRFSIRSLCREAREFYWNRRTDTEGFDLWYHLKGLVRAVNEGDPEYGIMGYNGGLFDDEQETFLGQHRLRNDFLARALYLMAYVQPPSGQGQEAEYEIPFRDLEVRHLGELYENILEFNVLLAEVPRIRRRTAKGVQTHLASEATFNTATDTRIEKGQVYFAQTALERKQSGSYYTPESLVGFLVNKAVIVPLRERFEAECRARLDEFIEQSRTGFDEHARQGAVREAEALILRFVDDCVLKFRVCDPAMGSGHFLVSTANRMTDLVIELLDEAPVFVGAGASDTTSLPNYWRRRVTRQCLYGVDLNPLAVDLAKLSLWLNSFATDHKLTFLDHRLKHGNSLMGIRSLDALNTIPKRKRGNPKKGEERLDGLFSHAMLTAALGRFRQLEQAAEDDTEAQRQLYEEAMDDLRGTLAPLADAYTTYLMVQGISPKTYRAVVEGLSSGRSGVLLDAGEIRAAQRMQEKLAKRHAFFHWPLEFPDVFGSEEGHGFDTVVGNPPWDLSSANPQEFFSNYDPDFRKLNRNASLRRITELCDASSVIAEKWQVFQQTFDEQNVYLKQPSAYVNSPSGRSNLYQYFLHRAFDLAADGGELGMVVPSGLYTDKGCQPLRKLFFEKSRIDSIYCFENRWPAVFLAVDNRFKFVTFCTRKGGQTASFKCAFMEHDPERLPAIDAECLMLSLDLVRRLAPKELSLPEVNTQKEADILDALHVNFPNMGAKIPNSWNSKIIIEFMSNTDAWRFEQAGEGRVPVYTGGTFFQYDVDFSSPYGFVDPIHLEGIYTGSDSPWQACRVSYRDVAASTNERTCISAILPPKTSCVEMARLLHLEPMDGQSMASLQCYVVGILNSFVLDFIVRRVVTSHLSNNIMERMPLPRIDASTPAYCCIQARVARLSCCDDRFVRLWGEVFSDTWQSPEFWYPSSLPAGASAQAGAPIDNYGPAHEQEIRKRLRDEAVKLTPAWGPHCGVHDRLPDRRDTGDRAQLRAEIDAYVAHLYGLSRDDFAYILDTFPVLKKKEEKAFGEFMSKRKCLEEYDRLGPIIEAQG